MLSCGSAQATLTPVGGELEISSGTAANTYHSRVAAGADGGFVVVWQSYVSSEDGGWNIAGRRFGSDGAPLADAFLVNTYTTGLQESPALAMSDLSELIVAWQGPDAADTDAVSARIYDAAGAAKGTQFRLHDATEQDFEHAPSVAAANGSFLGVWLRNDGLAGARVDTQGAALDTFSQDVSDIRRAAVESLPQGEFVVVWSTQSYAAPEPGASGYIGTVQGRRYAADGEPGEGFQVNSGREDPTGYGFVVDGGATLAIASDAHGGFTVGHDSYVPSYVYNVDEQVDGYDLGAKIERFDGEVSGGSEFADPEAASSAGFQVGPDVAVTPGGNTVLVWSDAPASPQVIDGGPADTDGHAVLARVLDCNGADLTHGAVQVNAYTTGEQRRPAVAVNEAGDVIVTWQTPRESGDGARIVGRRFTLSDGCALCGDVDANGRITAGDALAALRASVGTSVCELSRCDADGTEAITATDALRILTAAVANGGVKLACAPGPLQLNQSTAGSQTGPEAASLAGDRIAVAWTSNAQDESASDVFVRLFSAQLQPLTGELRVNTATAGTQALRAVSPLADGGFLVTWDDAGSALARRFDANGAPAGEPFDVAGGLGEAFAVDGDARFVVAQSAECTTQYGDAYACFAARRTPPEATSEGAQLYTTPLILDVVSLEMPPSYPVVAAASGGAFAVIWSAYENHHDNKDNELYMQLFDAAGGSSGTEQFVGSTGPRQVPAIASASEDGSFVVVWDTCTPYFDDQGYGGNGCYYAGISGERATEAGELDGFTVSSRKTYYTPAYTDRVQSASINPASEFVVVWQRTPSDDAARELLAQRYDQQADALGAHFRVIDENDGFLCCGRSVMLSDGAVVVAWQGRDADGSGVFARRFPAPSSNHGG